MKKFNLTIYSDYVCPWCYVGQGAVAKLTEEYPVTVDWRPFYLRPDTPPEGMDLPENVRVHMEQTNAHLKQMANEAGLEMVFPNRIPNTRLAHESTEYARLHGKALEFHRVIFDKFYGHGEDIGKWEVLREAANQVGLDANEMQQKVESGKFTGIVQEQVNEAYQIGVDGVPTYVLNDQYKIVGVQPYEVFQRALQQIETEEKG